MGRGIKKISENVIADKRSLTLVTKSEGHGLVDNASVPTGIMNTPAMPLGMLNVDYGTRGLSVKVKQGDNDAYSEWSRFDAKNTLIQQSIITNLIKDQNVTTEKIKDQNVTTAKIKDSAVTTIKIANQNVTTEKIADLNVTTGKINNLAVTEAKLSGDYNGGSNCAVSTRTIQNNAVTKDKIAPRSVTVEKMADNSVATRTIQPSAVTTDKLANSAVTTEKILNDAVTSEKIMDGTIRANNIAKGGVSNANLQDAAVSTDKIEDLAVTNAKLANESIIAYEKIMKGTITQELLDSRLFDMMDRVVLHDGNGNVTGENNSTEIDNLTAKGDIYARRVYNVVYMDIAEGYIPGEELEAGDIVAMHEDGKVYKAVSINDCIVGVVSNEYANCFGASEEEILAGEKVAVGMIGKIHVKIKGPVRLGQRVSIAPFDAGVGCANWMNNNNIGQVLETINCGYDEIHTVLVQVRPM